MSTRTKPHPAAAPAAAAQQASGELIARAKTLRLMQGMVELDPEEQYAALQRERLLQRDPTMLAYAAAQKVARATATAAGVSTGGAGGHGGDKAKAAEERRKERERGVNFGAAVA